MQAEGEEAGQEVEGRMRTGEASMMMGRQSEAVAGVADSFPHYYCCGPPFLRCSSHLVAAACSLLVASVHADRSGRTTIFVSD